MDENLLCTEFKAKTKAKEGHTLRGGYLRNTRSNVGIHFEHVCFVCGFLQKFEYSRMPVLSFMNINVEQKAFF